MSSSGRQVICCVAADDPRAFPIIGGSLRVAPAAIGRGSCSLPSWIPQAKWALTRFHGFRLQADIPINRLLPGSGFRARSRTMGSRDCMQRASPLASSSTRTSRSPADRRHWVGHPNTER